MYTLLSTNGTMDIVQVDHSQEIYKIDWKLLPGEGQKQTLQVVTSEGLGLDYYSNVVTIDYEVPNINRVVTSQYVALTGLRVVLVSMPCTMFLCCRVRVPGERRGVRNTYVLLTLEGNYFGGSPVVHLCQGS